MRNQELIKALSEAGFFSKEESDKILREAETTKKSAEEVIYARNLVREEDVAKLKSGFLKIPYKKPDPNSVTEEVFKLIPFETARMYQMVPLSKNKDMLVVGMVNPDNPSAQEALRFLAKQKRTNLGVFIITPSDVNLILRKFSQFSEEIQQALKSLDLKSGEGLSPLQRITKLDEGAAAGTTDAPIIRIVSSLLKEAVNLEASDIHIEPGRSKTRVRFRLDGALQEFMALPPELSQAVISRVKVMASLKLDETRIPQDGRFRTVIFEKEIDFRVSTFPTPNGEKAALRVLDPSVGLRNLDEIGIVGQNAELLKSGIQKPFGMVLLTGPTGSGKTTTLYALMRILNKESVNIISLEDPVEYTIDGVNQSQVKPEIGYDFSSGLRQILRQDPDILMVGEIRDKETAELSVHAALTGHILLSTLHTNNAVGVISRLLDMNVPAFLLPSALNLMAAQRLLSRICQKCKKTKDVPPAIAQVIKKEMAKLPSGSVSKYPEPYKVFQAPGCAVCKGKGIAGRIAIFEVFQMTPQLADIITTPGFNENRIAEEARRQGMLTLRQDGILKALDGSVNIEEVLRETEEL
ncbi:MAG TPA: GspE/PulE family protein [Candidatus Paceibacterota bacterium]